MPRIWNWRRGRCIAATTVAALACLISPVLAEQTNVEKKLEKLEQQLEEIRASLEEGKSTEKRIEKLDQDVKKLGQAVEARATARGRPKGLTDLQREALKAKLAASDHVNYSAEWHVGMPRK